MQCFPQRTRKLIITTIFAHKLFFQNDLHIHLIPLNFVKDFLPLHRSPDHTVVVLSLFYVHYKDKSIETRLIFIY